MFKNSNEKGFICFCVPPLGRNFRVIWLRDPNINFTAENHQRHGNISNIQRNIYIFIFSLYIPTFCGIFRLLSSSFLNQIKTFHLPQAPVAVSYEFPNGNTSIKKKWNVQHMTKSVRKGTGKPRQLESKAYNSFTHFLSLFDLDYFTLYSQTYK